ncbi:MAG: 2-dehydro-3-deoxygalactonokinase [Pseudomonadota bacterium]
MPESSSSPVLALVDWGTSSFRLWLVDENGETTYSAHSSEGMVAARSSGFDKTLEKHIADGQGNSNIPAVICGMAGAKTGWHQARYLALPADFEVIANAAVKVPDLTRDVFILPGIAKRNADAPDVMRGEETLVVGALANRPKGGAWCCLPGTHSKWVSVADGRISDFRTYMTGDLFKALSNHTILSQSSSGAGGTSPTIPLEQRKEFAQSVLAASSNPEQATALLFSIRAYGLLRDEDAFQAVARLSGTLIGLELAGMNTSLGNEPVLLISEGSIGACYQRAFEETGTQYELIKAEDAVKTGLIAAGRMLGLMPSSYPVDA